MLEKNWNDEVLILILLNLYHRRSGFFIEPNSQFGFICSSQNFPASFNLDISKMDTFLKSEMKAETEVLQYMMTKIRELTD